MDGQGESLLHAWLRAGDAGEVARFDEFLHPDVLVHAPLGLSTVGLEAEKQVWLTVLAGVPDLRHEIRECIVDGPTLAARVVVTGTHRGFFLGMEGTGKQFEIDQAVIAHVRDGRIVEAWEIADTALLMQQLGAIPTP